MDHGGTKHGIKMLFYDDGKCFTVHFVYISQKRFIYLFVGLL